MKDEQTTNVPPVIPAATSEPETSEKEDRPTLAARLAERWQREPPRARDVNSKERLRGLVVLAFASLACIVLFLGIFTTDSKARLKARSTQPNLGRPAAQSAAEESPKRSPVPGLTVEHQPGEEPSEVTERDILGTMRNQPPPTPAAPPKTLNSIEFEGPALMEAYRRGGVRPPERVPVANDLAPRVPAAPAVAETRGHPAIKSEDMGKSSFVFVRSASSKPQSRPISFEESGGDASPLLPPGTALVARLQHTVSSAAKAPVIAVIEYNYEDAGRIVVPAGSKAYGELTDASPQGWVGIRFHTLELPSGATEPIAGSALSLERGPLKGAVNGKNTGKKLLTRALTGVGTIAAFAVGGRGLSGPIDNPVLLRERIASNVALAGEQQLAQIAYQQNIVVTVPAQTRFYLVLHESGSRRASPRASTGDAAQPRSSGASLASFTEQEIRELLQLRNEVREMNRLLPMSAPKSEQAAGLPSQQ